jgi:hypothetical protein
VKSFLPVIPGKEGEQREDVCRIGRGRRDDSDFAFFDKGFFVSLSLERFLVAHRWPKSDSLVQPLSLKAFLQAAMQVFSD